MAAFSVPLVLFLAAVLGASAVGKLLSSDRGRAGFDALEIRVANPNAAAAALIVTETAVALGLVFTTGWFFVVASGAAAVLTAALLLVVVRAYRLGSRDDCGCFGDWLPAAIGPRLIARNVVLVVMSTAVFVATLIEWVLLGLPVGVPEAFAAGPGSVAALGALIALLLIALATWATARAAADATASAPIAHGGGAVVVPATAEVIDLLAPGTRARLVVFVSPGCHACTIALARLREAQAEVAELVDVYIVQRVIHGSITATSDHVLPEKARYAIDVGGSLGAALELGVARPVAALISAEGTQAGPLAIGSEETTALINSIVSLADVPTP